MVALRSLSCLARKTTCSYCGARIPGTLGQGMHSTEPARDKLAREAARFSCREHRDVAMAELVHRRSVEGGDE